MTMLEGEFIVERFDDQLQINVVSFSSSEIAIKVSGMNNLDWRYSVEKIAIDPDYDGEKFQSDIIDRPDAAIDYVKGKYTLLAEKTGGCVAVKITDILGDSIIISKTIDK